MTDTEIAEPAMFNPLADGFVDWPYDQYRRLRAEDPIHRSDLLHGWCVTRYADVNTILRDPTVSVGDRQRHADPADDRRDPPPRRVGARRPHAGAARRPRPRPAPQARDEAVPTPGDRAAARTSSRSGSGRGSTQLIAEHGQRRAGRARPDRGLRLPAAGRDLLPDARHPRGGPPGLPVLGQLHRPLARPGDGSRGARARSSATSTRCTRFLEELVEAKRGRDDDDILSDLIHAEEDGAVAHPRGADRPDHHALRRRPRADRRARRQRHAGAARATPTSGRCCSSDRSLLRNAVTRAAALRRPEPVRASHRDARHGLRHAGGHRSRSRPAPSSTPPRRSANRDEAQLGTDRRRGRHHPGRRRAAPPVRRRHPLVPRLAPGPPPGRGDVHRASSTASTTSSSPASPCGAPAWSSAASTSSRCGQHYGAPRAPRCSPIRPWQRRPRRARSVGAVSGDPCERPAYRTDMISRRRCVQGGTPSRAGPGPRWSRRRRRRGWASSGVHPTRPEPGAAEPCPVRSGRGTG